MSSSAGAPACHTSKQQRKGLIVVNGSTGQGGERWWGKKDASGLSGNIRKTDKVMNQKQNGTDTARGIGKRWVIDRSVTQTSEHHLGIMSPLNLLIFPTQLRCRCKYGAERDSTNVTLENCHNGYCFYVKEFELFILLSTVWFQHTYDPFHMW